MRRTFRGWLIMALLVLCAPNLAQASGTDYTTLVGDPPTPNKSTFFEWANRLILIRTSEIGGPRTTRYFFSASSGDDDAGIGDVSSPFQSISKANQIIEAAPQNADLEISFRQGDVWRELGAGLIVKKSHITLSDYYLLNEGNKGKPIFTQFTHTYQGGWTQQTGGTNTGNRYSRPETFHAGWVRYANDPFFRNILIHTNSIAECDAMANSWFYDDQLEILHINLNGANPNDSKLEMAEENHNTGLFVTPDGQSVDDVVIKNLRFEGYSLSGPPGHSPQGYVININAANRDRVLLINDEAYYGPYHLIGQTGSNDTTTPGGIVTYVNCRAGWGRDVTVGVYNTHSGPGLQESIYLNCKVAGGALPDTYWYDPKGAIRAGSGFYGHTGGGSWKIGLAMCMNCEIENNPFGADSGATWGDLPPSNSISQVRGFVIGEKIIGAQPIGKLNVCGPNMVWINCQYDVRRQFKNSDQTTTFSQNAGPLGGWAINTIMKTDQIFANSNSGGFQNPKVWHCRLIRSSSDIVGQSQQQDNWVVDRSQFGCRFVNTIFEFPQGFSEDSAVNAPNFVGGQIGNMYVNVAVKSNMNLQNGYDFTTDPADSPDGEALIPAANPVAGFPVEYDIHMQRRNLLHPMRGPVETPLVEATKTAVIFPSLSNNAPMSLGDPNGGTFSGSATETSVNGAVSQSTTQPSTPCCCADMACCKQPCLCTTQPATTTQPAMKPCTKPCDGSCCVPGCCTPPSQPATQPAAQPATQPAIQPATQPASHPTPTPPVPNKPKPTPPPGKPAAKPVTPPPPAKTPPPPAKPRPKNNINNPHTLPIYSDS